ncbi:single-stranded DNA-binding protein [Salegentibacter mishustinae]|jgi:single-strand DNA-binding protein|uniref:Single-stranded DNA-binding protein n=1 Tax=Salegentibacter mishustinae TaxID=270918 RepID=A0A0Q9ZH93_9FLAO|nr:single-stranded DNA-binding protein [Salegentibacter mishustinae]KRG27475.1 single-stranded DNA-binding protein [Salegentibacter mishustinae]PNW20466.1 single-stranded DNA-binding protein [Salegentibacter mishustinae]PZX63264.1 single-strand DNA-binding protein [Salegentibacter mishustinae]UBZ07857.1 single-stranded DNA-binding protein [Salegentibacter mishustinae]GGW92934.1 single-stranded DNA-binding protein [Salegentibacter mishustinae]
MTGTLNKVMLIGHTGDDVKMHYFEGGGAIGRFPLATNETYTNRTTNERVTNTEWHNIVVRNKAAEVCEKYLKKGDKVYIEGRIKTRKWQDDQGNDRYTTEIQCTEFTFLTPKGENEGGGNMQQQNSPAQSQQNTPKNDNFANQSMAKEEEEDDLPF